jgi:1-deoxy-D-xylulose-5-phosphate reductoisomerase
VEVLTGPDAAEMLAREADADMVLNALVGSVGLVPTLATLQSGKMLALANKESLIVGGELVMDLIKGEPERLVPGRLRARRASRSASAGERREDLKRVVLTGSGGPFRGWTHSELTKASVKEALAHPVWQMGPKITIDSATLMNKGLEVIEAHYLFNLEYSAIHVVIHPRADPRPRGVPRRHPSSPRWRTADMRLPIQLALAWPERLPGRHRERARSPIPRRLQLRADRPRGVPAVDLAYRVGELGLTFPCVMSAANEVAVMAFLENKIPLTRITEVVSSVVDEHEAASVVSVVNLERADGWARRRAAEIIEAR